MAGESYKKAISKAKEDIQALKTGIDEISGSVGKLDVSIINKLNEAIGKSPAELVKKVSGLEKAIEKLVVSLNKQKKMTKQLSDAQKAQQKLLGHERENNAILNKNTKEQATLQSKLATEYDKVKVRRDQAQRTLRELILSEKSSAKEIKKAATAYQKYQGQLDIVREKERALANAKQNKAAREKAQSDAISRNVQRHIKDMTKQSDIQKRLSADYKIWERESKRAAAALEKEKAAMAKAAAAAKEYANEYNKLKRRRDQTLKKLRTLLATEGANTKAIEKASKAYARYGAKLDEIRAKERALVQEQSKAKNNARISKQMTGQMREHVEAIGRTSDGLKKMNAYYRDLEKTSAKDARNKEKQAKATAHLSRAYVQLEMRQRKARDTLRDYIAAGDKSNHTIRKAQREYDRLTKKLNQARAATANLNKTSLTGVLRGVRNLMSAFGIAGGLFLFADIVKQGFTLAKQLDAIDFAMKTVITDAKELARTKEFLGQITEDYGAALVTTTERYNKFMAAAKQSNVTMADTELIFGTMTKAAGALGLRSHELEGVFLALEQMLSKGKVTTEELRRQLGERLPGAFGIMAAAVNELNPDVDITVDMLDKMLKKGEVLSAEVLPEFARQVEKAYGLENLKRVENLNAATTRLSNAWVRLVQDFTKSGGAINSVLVKAINGLAKSLTDLGEGFKEINHELQVGKNAWDKFASFLNGLKGESEAVNVALTMIMNTLLILKALFSIKIWDVWAFIIKGLVTTFTSFAVAIEQVVDEFRDLEGLLTDPFGISEAWNRVTNSFTEVWSRAYGEVKLGVWEVGDEIDLFMAKYGSLAPLAPDMEAWDFTKLGPGVGTINDVTDATDGMTEAIEGSADWIRQQISLLEEKRNKLVNTHEAYEEINKEIREYEEQLRNLTEGEAITANWLQTQIGLLKDKRDRLAETHEEYKEITKAMEEYEEMLRRIVEGEKALSEIKKQTLGQKLDEEEEERVNAVQKMLDEEVLAHRKAAQIIEAIRTGSMENVVDLTKEEYEWIKSLVDKEIEDKKELAAKTKELALAAMTGVMERRVELVQREIEENRDYYAELLNNQELSEEQRDALEAERDVKERKLEKKKRKREKEAFLLQQAIAVSEVAIQLAKTIALINAAAAAIDSVTFGVGGQVYRSANLPIAIGTAAVQTGIILAQSLPQFEKGTDNAPEGLAIVDEVVPEVHTDKFGRVKSFGLNKPNYRMLEQGDKIYPSREEYLKETGKGLDQNELQRRIFSLNLQSEGKELDQKQVDNALLISGMNDIKRSNENLWLEVKTLARRPIDVHNTVEIEDNRHY